MTQLEDLKNEWVEKQGMLTGAPAQDPESLKKIIRRRTGKHLAASMRYFWAYFVFQIIVYALLSHVIIVHWRNPFILSLSIAGIILYLPFMVFLMRNFKKIASTKFSTEQDPSVSIYNYVFQQYTFLRNFYRFKKLYELFLVPVSAAIGVILSFTIFVPGSVKEHPVAAAITFVLTLISCMWAIRSENKTSFRIPIRQLQQILDEYRVDSEQ
ncbi:hypothetical protein GS399_19715 [Pedobacter sp. HMF7647]|uniref:Uncharacterized protein n=1 Tax=Hufsiella arboris TaxID=2695275 RepID=A0A7K1YFJ9_9SPHI|nr:hypothetical protein [Hufsiella arboris]MXV53200.1 hypothetical protein [Hufsiella arboris]